MNARVAEREVHAEQIDSLKKAQNVWGVGLWAARSCCGAAQAKLDEKLAEAVE